MAHRHILAIDQGTTSSRAILFNEKLSPVATGQQEFTQYFPRSGWVEHDAEEIWTSVLATCKTALSGTSPDSIAAIGITNQRETIVLWDRATGTPLHNAIVWQDRRTSDYCTKLKEAGHEQMITAKTGLLLDPYFSSTKLAWLLDNIEGARAAAEDGKLAAGTMDSYLIWRLTNGASHVTDATNAARTMLYNIRQGCWDQEILELFNIPQALLPDVLDSDGDFGITAPEYLGTPIPIRGVAGDQQAATVGQACFAPGMLKSTYGTGCFALLNTGGDLVQSQNRLLGTIAYQLGGKTTYALEGSIFVAGAVVQWLRDGLGIISAAAETGPLAEQADPQQDVIIVPAFTGLGAPYWNAECRGATFGLSRNSGPKEMARAALESVGYQTRDLLEAMRGDWNNPDQTTLRVDGGMTASDPAMQFLSDILGAPVDRPKILETTALGAAWLAGQAIELYPDQDAFAKTWALDRRFDPMMDEEHRKAKYARWKRAVTATLSV